MRAHRNPFRALPRPMIPSGSATPGRAAVSAEVWSSCRKQRQPGVCDRTYSAVSAADLKFGQPVYETHPHMLAPGEITPGISAQEYADRRTALAHSLTDNAIALLPSAPLLYKSGAVFHPYRQNSNFLYLTGWNCPSPAIAIIQKTGPAFGDYKFTMFVTPKHEKEEQWTGYRNGLDAARDVFNADEVLPIREFEGAVGGICKGRLVYTDSGEVEAVKGLKAFFRGERQSITPLFPVVNKLRVIKSPAEVNNMRIAGQTSGRAITEAMRRSWSTEKALHRFLDYEFTNNGCDGTAYIPVVAGGERANCIHYTVNDQKFDQSEFALVDAGAEYGTYITDISRTWPLSGKFTAPQKALYNAVLGVQRTAVSLCRQSANLSLEEIHGITSRALLTALQNIGFTKLDTYNINALFPHHVGHYIGLDVHDCPGYSRREKLVKGHCVTIEPGVYVPRGDERWPKEFWGMGVRIEDSVCVDDESSFVLSVEAVKEVDDIEALRS